MQYELDAGHAVRLGLVVLSTDETVESDARSVLTGHDVGLYHSRIFSSDTVTPDTLMSMQARMAASVSLLPEGVDAIAYGCTSASVLIGPDGVEKQVHSVRPGTHVTNPISGALAGLRALNAHSIALVTPYAASVAAPMRAFFEAQGIAVAAEISFGEDDDRNVARISEASTAEAIRAAVSEGGADAVFASCTNLRTFGLIDALEDELKLPVLSSNQAMMWHLLTLAGLAPVGWGPGHLFRAEG